MLFVGGPCTAGPGQVAALSLAEPIRAQHTLDECPYTKSAYQFYEGLAQRSASMGHCVDVFMGCLDQCGYYEMRDLVEITGGFTVLSTDGFVGPVFGLSFNKLWNPPQAEADLDMVFDAVITVNSSPEIKVSGALGHFQPVERTPKAPSVSDIEIGRGGTNQWRCGGISSQSTIAFFFDIANQATPPPPESPPFVQFQTCYWHPSGRRVMRVTSHQFTWAHPARALQDVGESFDQETAACLMARLAVHKAKSFPLHQILAWVDRSLIHLLQKFALYTKQNQSTFQLPQAFSLFPQFVFYMRRSRFLRLFNHTPDETAFYRSLLNRETCSSMLLMIYPCLFAWEYGKEMEPCLLDINTISESRILLLDNFFRITVHHGLQVAEWRRQYKENPTALQHLRPFLEAPNAEINKILAERFPVPSVLICDQNSSQARFLTSQLNPSIAAGAASPAGAAYFSDDVCLKKFMDSLVRLVVS
eukprot:GAFH01001281.1.p1 GENE.GAFH01001281.1~~GAFH01001281.1.p1  ORF type:complete len:530 (-),score=184.69 GAFH01001281.1:159-1580(-)